MLILTRLGGSCLLATLCCVVCKGVWVELGGVLSGFVLVGLGVIARETFCLRFEKLVWQL